MLQNRFIMGIMSAFIVLSGVLFIMQPTKAHAQAQLEMRRDKNGIVIFGRVALTDGAPVSGADLLVGQKRDRRATEMYRIFDRDTTDANGNYKLWISAQQAANLDDRDVTIAVRPDSNNSYEQNLNLDAGDAVSMTIAMRTPVIPIFPFTIFVY